MQEKEEACMNVDSVTYRLARGLARAFGENGRITHEIKTKIEVK